MKTQVFRFVLAAFVVSAALSSVTAICLSIHANALTIGMAYVVVVLLTSLLRGLAPAIFASIFATLCLNYYFLPPVGTFTIDRTEDWIALAAFLISAVLVSRLSAAVQKRAVEAERARDELAGLYRLNQSMMTATFTTMDPETIAKNVAEAFGAQYCGFHSSTGQKLDVLVEEHALGVRYVEVRAGDRLLGVLTLKPDTLSKSTLDAIASVLALALDRRARVV